MQPVQQPNRPIVQIELLMMLVMHPRHAAHEIIPAMHHRRVGQLVPQKRPERHEVAVQQRGRQRDRQDVGGEVLERVRVLRGERDGRGEVVVQLVDACVEEAVVEQAVGVVEEGFAEEQAGEEVEGEFARGGEEWVEAVGAGGEEGELEEVEGGGEELVAEDEEGAGPEGGAGGLFGGGLEFVSVGEGGEEVVEGEEEEGGEPEGEELDGEGAEEFDGLGTAGGEDRGPE
ncbi:hypothetical protein PRK78_007409 [Emydomyces testavorans]|uniref:Uncharacterized protein n=1 Tax=Emydomyces testavorans TaxID=2070801 RepID=A0AAF0DP73_9EURO|nr:hypothetical protein PRK78_007409 [Emydomyces testavorans]